MTPEHRVTDRLGNKFMRSMSVAKQAHEDVNPHVKERFTLFLQNMDEKEQNFNNMHEV